jgi:hypothetical protein
MSASDSEHIDDAIETAVAAYRSKTEQKTP